MGLNDRDREYFWRRLQRRHQRQVRRVEWQADMVMVLFALSSVVVLAVVLWRLP